MITGELKNKVDKIWETCWTGGIPNPLSVIEQLTYLLFIKGLDQEQARKEKIAERTGKPIENPFFDEDQQHLRWRNIKELEPETMLIRIKDEVFPFIKKLGDDDKSTFGKYMKDALFMFQKPSILARVVDLLDDLPMENRDTKGDIYEYMLSKLSTAGQSGQFRTPRHIIDMMVKLSDPKPMETVADPACGTAGFLVSSGQYLLDNYEDELMNDKVRKHFQEQMFHGFDFDPTMLRIGNMNMFMHGFEGSNIDHKDSLSSDSNELRDKYDLILANPPFKGSLDYESVAKDLLQTVKTKKTELLFLALFIRALRIGGRAAVIVPDGVLFGSSRAHKEIRRLLVEEQQLNAVISMPSGVFKPYAGVSTAVIIFTKTNSGGTDNVWFYDMKADGYSLDDKRDKIEDDDIPEIVQHYSYWRSDFFEKMHTEKGDVINANDLPENLGFDDFPEEVLTHDFSSRTSKSFLVPKNEIVEQNYDLSINRYKEIEYEEVEYDDPKTIINGKDGQPGLRQLAEERLKILNELEGMV
ncbi:MAG: type I restriction-modification system subunit M [Gracilimonas sp.]|uniref:type I restriction-modification system subunit M n=1 Tax=Gracilimonas sp. TaxID=1974203 RepID=UPI0037509FDE|nr:type I restriction-modification system subunit M [Gracilimonas sp.]